MGWFNKEQTKECTHFFASNHLYKAEFQWVDCPYWGKVFATYTCVEVGSCKNCGIIFKRSTKLPAMFNHLTKKEKKRGKTKTKTKKR